MKAIQKSIIMAGIAVMAACPVSALAADATAPAAASGLTFGIVDMSKVLQTTDAAKDVVAQIEAKRKEYKEKTSKEDDALRAAAQDFEKNKSSLSKDAYESKAKELNEKYTGE